MRKKAVIVGNAPPKLYKKKPGTVSVDKKPLIVPILCVIGSGTGLFLRDPTPVLILFSYLFENSSFSLTSYIYFCMLNSGGLFLKYFIFRRLLPSLNLSHIYGGGKSILLDQFLTQN